VARERGGGDVVGGVDDAEVGEDVWGEDEWRKGKKKGPRQFWDGAPQEEDDAAG
jgi:hypothetical protein